MRKKRTKSRGSCPRARPRFAIFPASLIVRIQNALGSIVSMSG